MNLRYQDYKSVTEYNSAMFGIASRLELCGDPVTQRDMIEKTLSTFHASNVLLQQQYRERNFTRVSELISVLLVAEANNKVLMKNHNARPTGSMAVPESHANQFSFKGKRNARRRGSGKGYRGSKGKGPATGANRVHVNSGKTGKSANFRKRKNTWTAPKAGKQIASTSMTKGTCYKCGQEGHWARNCDAPKDKVAKFQSAEANALEWNPPSNEPEVEADGTMLTYNDFFEDRDDFLEEELVPKRLKSVIVGNELETDNGEMIEALL
jgi:hypothetical protein